MKYIRDNVIKKDISRIGLGTARMGSRYSIEQSEMMLDCYFSLGGNFFDTARNYSEWYENGRGKSEETLGKWISRKKNRGDVCILTKGGTQGHGSRIIDISQKQLEIELEESLEALQTNYIDIYALHRDDVNMSAEKIIYSLQSIVEKGNIKRLCADCWTVDRIKIANEYAKEHNLIPFSCVETWWSLAEYKKEMWNDDTTTNMTEELYDFVDKNEMLAIGVTSQCRGFFQKAISNGIENIDEFLYKRIVTDRNIKKMKYIKKYCEQNNVSVTAFVNSYITSDKIQGIGLVSCSEYSQLIDIMNNSDFEMPLYVKNELDKI